MKDPKDNIPNKIAGVERIKTKGRDRTQDGVEERSHDAPWLFDEFPCAVWRSDKDGKCDYVNRAWLDLRGRTMEQELGDGWTEGVHPDDLDFCQKTYLNALNARRAFEIEYRLRGHDGEYRWMNDCGRPFNDLEGNFGGYIGTCFDTTERKQAEESRKLFRSLMDRSSDAIEVIDPDTLRFLDCNESACQCLGYSREEFLALSVFDIDPKTNESSAAAVAAEMKRSGFAMFESIHRRKDGSTFPVEVNVREIQLERAYRLAIVRDITERKQAEERLREYERVVEGLEEMIVVIDRDYRYLVANRAYLNNRGLERDQVIGHYVSEVLDPETFEKIVKQKLDECFQGRVVKYEVRYFYPKLGDRDLLISYFPIEGPGGVEQTACILRDITERKRAEGALREAERKYREIFENAGEGIFQSTPGGRFISANPALARMHGFDSPEELIRSRKDITREIYVDHNRREEFKRLLEEHGIVRGFEHQAFRKDGSKIWISVNARAVSDELGAILYYEGTAQDINERKRAEEELLQSEERYRELFENAKDAIYVHDLSGRYTSVNRAAELLSGFKREEILGKHFSNFVSPRDLKQVRTNLCQKLDLENETIYEVDLVTRSGRRVPVEVSSRLIFENGVAAGVQGTARDISDRKRAQEGLRIYSQRLIEAQEAERQHIARELHDEIGQVLTAVRINLQAMQRSGGKNENGLRLDESIAVVDEALGRVRELSIELRPSLLDDLGLSAALRWYVERYAQRTGIIAEVLNGFEEDGRLSRELETVCFRIAQEALTNAARHAQAASISVQLERSREEMLLTIIDDGVGFDFDKLRKGASTASALGLRGMEERAFTVGGRIEIDSGPGRGTRVRATFPLKRK